MVTQLTVSGNPMAGVAVDPAASNNVYIVVADGGIRYSINDRRRERRRGPQKLDLLFHPRLFRGNMESRHLHRYERPSFRSDSIARSLRSQ